MPKYTVDLYRKVVLEQIAYVTVDAASEAEARLVAVERAEEEQIEFAAALKAAACLPSRPSTKI